MKSLDILSAYKSCAQERSRNLVKSESSESKNGSEETKNCVGSAVTGFQNFSN